MRGINGSSTEGRKAGAMRRKEWKWAAVCSVILISFGGCHRVDENHQPTAASGERKVRSDSALDKPTRVSDEKMGQVMEPVLTAEQGIADLWTLFAGEPQRSFQGGREDLLSKKYRTASQKIRKGIIYVKLQTLRAYGTTKSALQNSESSLIGLAQEVEKGNIQSLGRMDATFAATHRAIARLHQEKARKAYARGELRVAGVELQAAKDNVRRAAVWTGDHVDPAVIDCTERAGHAAGRLMEEGGADRAPVETRKALSDLRAQIDRLDRKAEAEEAWGMFVDETEFYLKQARSRLESRDARDAAANMRRAAACMSLESFGAFGDAKHVLEKEIQALRKAAGEVENGSLTSLKRLGQRFAGAQYALAKVHHRKAGRYHAQHYYNRAVTALRATVTDLERAVSWAGKSMKKSSVRYMTQVKEMSKKMREGRRVSAEEISTALLELNRAIAVLDYLAAVDK